MAKGISPLLLLGGALVGYSLLRQGQNTAATLTTGRVASFQPVRLRGTNLECLAVMRFDNTHPSRPANLQRLGVNVQSEDGVVFATAYLPAGQQPLPASATTNVQLPVVVELMPLVLQVINLAEVPALLRSFTSVGEIMTWLTTKAGLRNCVIEGQAQVDGVVLPLRQVVNLGLFAPAPKKPAPATPASRGKAITKKTVA